MTVLTPLGDKRVVEKQDVSFECVVSKPNKSAAWSKDDKPICASDRVQVAVDGARHFLNIKSAVLDDDATYKIQVESAVSTGKLIVEGQPPMILVVAQRRVVAWWLSGRALDLRFTGRGFNSRPVAFT